MFRTAVFAALFALAGAAHAQSSGATSLEAATTSTPDEMRAFATTAVEDIKSRARDVAKLTEQARKDSDAGVLDCLTPRNVSMQALVQVATGATQKMNEALDAGDRERANHEYRKIAVSMEKARSINGEAQGCATGEGGRGEDDVRVTSDGAGDDQDTVDNDEIDDLDIGFDPPPVSPFRND